MKTQTITTTWTCDRCGKDMVTRGYNYCISCVSVSSRAYDYNGNGAGRNDTYDLCHDCTIEFGKFIKHE